MVGSPNDWGVSHSLLRRKNPPKITIIPGRIMADRHPYSCAIYATHKGIKEPPTFWEVAHIDHHRPRSDLEYQCDRRRAHEGQPNPWNQPLKPQKRMSIHKDDERPKKMLKNPVAISPMAIKYRGFDLSPITPLTNLLTP